MKKKLIGIILALAATLSVCAGGIFVLLCERTNGEDAAFENTDGDNTAAIPGDADTNGTVNTKDVFALLRYCAGYDIHIDFSAADADASGSVNVRDAAMLMKYLAGWSVSLGKPAPVIAGPNVTSVLAIPEYSGNPFVELNGGRPTFTESEITAVAYEYYAPLDSLGRCVYAAASVGKETMPTEERGEIGMIKPSGWHTVKYDFVDGKYLYNRCHLIGYQLTGENANLQNLITGTRSLNTVGMLPFENKIADYVRRTGNHVVYRVTPLFYGNEPLCRGVIMEACSAEDGGDGLSFNVFVYNVEPGVAIDYTTGESTQSDKMPQVIPTNEAETDVSGRREFVLNANTGVFHLPECDSVADMKKTNRRDCFCRREDLTESGYKPCSRCKP